MTPGVFTEKYGTGESVKLEIIQRMAATRDDNHAEDSYDIAMSIVMAMLVAMAMAIVMTETTAMTPRNWWAQWWWWQCRCIADYGNAETS